MSIYKYTECNTDMNHIQTSEQRKSFAVDPLIEVFTTQTISTFTNRLSLFLSTFLHLRLSGKRQLWIVDVSIWYVTFFRPTHENCIAP
jgi:hypothetical protein